MELPKLYPLREDLRFLSKRFAEEDDESLKSVSSVILKMSDVNFRIDDISYGDMGLIDTEKYQNLQIDTYEMTLTMRKLKSQIDRLEEFIDEEIEQLQNQVGGLKWEF